MMHFIGFFPAVPSNTEQFMLNGMTYKAKIFLGDDDPPLSEVQVQSWTSQCDAANPGGHWHSVDLIHVDETNNAHTFGKTVIVTSTKDFEFTFRMRINTASDWIWSHSYGCNGYVRVLGPRDNDQWTLGPDFNHIEGALYLGNFIAACHATELGFTHVLNVADTLDIVPLPGDPLVYHKIPMQDGGHNPIEEGKLKAAVEWLQQHNHKGNKILVNCRAGIGRAGSTAVAFVFANHPQMTFQEAYEFCSEKRFVYPHVGVRESLPKLFPRIKS